MLEQGICDATRSNELLQHLQRACAYSALVPIVTKESSLDTITQVGRKLGVALTLRLRFISWRARLLGMGDL